MSAWIASQAACFTAAGAGKSGKPCDRLTPPYNSFNRVISRITDSVNCVALCEPVSLDMKAPRARDSTLRGLLAFLRCGLLLHDPRLALCGRLLRGSWRGRRL